jgi:ketosteroid isomerase-like protein
MRTDTSTFSLDSPLVVVERMLAAFATDDMEGILATVHPESRWSYLGANPAISTAEFTGRAAVRGFFEGIMHRLAFTSFDPEEVVVQKDTVVVFGSEAGTVRATGQPFRNRWVQKYVVQGGMIVSMSEYNVQVEPQT